MKTEKPLPPPGKGKVAPATFAIGRVGEGLKHPKHVPHNPNLSTLARQGNRVLCYANIDVSQQFDSIHDDLSNHLERATS